MNKYIFVFLFTIATQAQTFNFSCAPPIDNPFTDAQITRLTSLANGYEPRVNNNVVYYIKSFDNNIQTRYTIEVEPNGFIAKYYDNRQPEYYAHFAHNNADTVIDAMLARQVQTYSWINPTQRATLTGAGFRWNANTDRFELTYWNGKITLRSVGTNLLSLVIPGTIDQGGNDSQLDRLIDLAIEESNRQQPILDEAIDAFSSQFDALGSDFEVNSTDNYAYFNVQRIDDGLQIGFITLIEQDGAIQYQVNGGAKQDTVEVAFRFIAIGWSQTRASSMAYISGKWRSHNATQGYQEFHHSSVAIDYEGNGLIGELGFTGEQVRKLTRIHNNPNDPNGNWVYTDSEFTKSERNGVRIVYGRNIENVAEYKIYVLYEENSSWGQPYTRPSVQAAVTLANEQINRVL